MKTIIIPDIHNKFDIAESIIEKEKPDNVVFLGDYFDSFDDSVEIAYQTAAWLKESLEKPNRIHLLGNHDLSYKDTRFACSGFSEAKLAALKQIKIDLSKLEHYCWVGDWLCTHAGLSNEFYKEYGMGRTVNDFLQIFSQNKEGREKLYECSPNRGGLDRFSGIVWCDYSEFEDIPGIKQIFGHTRGLLRETENHICLDTGLRNYAIHECGVMMTNRIIG